MVLIIIINLKLYSLELFLILLFLYKLIFLSHKLINNILFLIKNKKNKIKK